MSRIRSRIAGIRSVLADDETLRAVLKHTGWLTGSSGIVLALYMIQGILTARLLGVVTWGVLGVSLSFVAVVSRLLSFRMNDFVVKWVGQFGQEDPQRAPTAFKLALAGDVGTAVLAFVVVEVLAAWGATVFAKSPDLAWVFRVVGLTALLQAGNEAFIGMLQVNREFRIQGLVQVAGQVTTVSIIALVYFGGGGLEGVLFAIVLGYALMGVLFWTFGLGAARTTLGAHWASAPFKPPDGLGREMMRFAVMVNISGTLKSTMADGDLLILGFATGPAQVAYYKLAKSIYQIAQLPNMPMVNAFFPELNETSARGEWEIYRRLLRRGSKAAAAWVLPVSLGLVALSPLAIQLLYGPSFVPAVPALALLLVGACVDGVLFWTRAALLSLGQPGYDTSINLVATAAKVLLALLVVPSGGYLAMAALTSLVVISQNLVSARRVYATIRIRESAAVP